MPLRIYNIFKVIDIYMVGRIKPLTFQSFKTNAIESTLNKTTYAPTDSSVISVFLDHQNTAFKKKFKCFINWHI